MPPKENLDGYMSTIRSGVDEAKASVEAYSKVLGDLNKVAKDGNADFEALKRKINDSATAFMKFDSSSLAALRTMREIRKEVDRGNKEIQNQQRQMKMAIFLAGNWKDQLKGLESGIVKVTSGIKSFGQNLSNLTKGVGGKGLSFALSDVRSELLQLNRAMFESGRQAQMMGGSNFLNLNNWKSLRGELAMSLSEFKKLQVEVNRLTFGTMIDDQAMLQMTKKFQKAFGIEDVANSMKRLLQMDSNFAGFKEYLQQATKDGLEGGFRGLPGIAQSMALQGASAMDIQKLFQLRQQGGGQSAEMEFEKALKAKEASIADMNARMGKNSESALISIEKSMTHLVETIDTLVNSLSAIPTVLMGAQAIGLPAIVALGKQMWDFGRLTKEALQNMRDLGRATAAAGGGGGGAGGGGGIPAGTYPNPSGGLKPQVFMNPANAPGGAGGTQLGRMARFKALMTPRAGNLYGSATGIAGTVAGAAMMGYGYHNIRGGAGDYDQASDWKERNAASGRMSSGSAMATAGAGALLGTMIAPGIGTAIGGVAGYGLGWGVDKIWGHGQADEKIMQNVENLQYTRLFKGDTMQDVETGGNKALAERALSYNIRALGKDIGKEGGIQKRMGRAAALDDLRKRDAMFKAIEKSGGDVVKSLMEIEGPGGEKRLTEDQAKKLYEMYQTRQKDLKAAKEKEDAEYKSLALMMKHKEILSGIAETYGNLSSQARGVADSMSGLAYGAGVSYMKESADYAWQQVEAQQKVIQQMATIEGKKEFRLGVVESTGMRETMMAKGLTEEEATSVTSKIADLDPLKVTSEKIMEIVKNEAGDREDIKKWVEDEARGLERAFIIQMKLKKEAALRVEQMKLEQSMRSAAKQSADAEAYRMEGRMNLQQKFLQLAQSETQIAEKTVAGHAMSFKARLREYKMVGEQMRTGAELVDQLQRKEKEEIGKNGEFRKKFANELALMQSSNMEDQQRGAMMLSEKYNNLGEEEKKAYHSIIELMNKRLDSQLRLNQLTAQQRDMILQMKEGYLDVINEMTTGTDLVSQMLPDAQRGVMAMYKMSMYADGMQAGALRRGFITMDQGAGYTDMSQAMKWMPGGLAGNQEMTKIVNRLLTKVEDSVENVLPQNVRGTKTIEQSSALVKGVREYADGGVIPGTPSNVDNKLGMIGNTPIGLAGGEYIVNAKQTSKFMPLLEMINSGKIDGLAGGGLSRIKRGADYTKMPIDELKSRAAMNDYAAIEELVRRNPGTYSSVSDEILQEKADAGNWQAAAVLDSRIRKKEMKKENAARLAKSREAKEKRLQRTVSEMMEGTGYLPGMDKKVDDQGWVSIDKKFADAGIKSGEWTTLEKQERRIHEAGWRAEKNAEEIQANYDRMVLGIDDAHSEAMTNRHKLSIYEDLYGPVEGLSRGGPVGGGMRIGALYLNGKVIGQDISSGPSEELKMAMQNANG